MIILGLLGIAVLIPVMLTVLFNLERGNYYEDSM